MWDRKSMKREYDKDWKRKSKERECEKQTKWRERRTWERQEGCRDSETVNVIKGKMVMTGKERQRVLYTVLENVREGEQERMQEKEKRVKRKKVRRDEVRVKERKREWKDKRVRERKWERVRERKQYAREIKWGERAESMSTMVYHSVSNADSWTCLLRRRWDVWGAMFHKLNLFQYRLKWKGQK